MAVSLLFGLFVLWEKGLDVGMLFYTGYLVEFSLSMDNIFVISLVFTSFQNKKLPLNNVRQFKKSFLLHNLPAPVLSISG